MNQKINYLTCKEQQTHADEELNLICIDEECKEKQQLICPHCENDKHYKHKIISLKYFLNRFVAQEDQLQNSFKTEDLLKIIETSSQQSKIQIENFSSQIFQKIEDLKQKSWSFFEKLKKEILILFNPYKTPSKIIIDQIYKGQYQNQNQLAADLQILISQISITDNLEIQLKTNLKELSAEIQIRSEDFENHLKEGYKYIQEHLKTCQDRVFEEIQLKNVQASQHFKFSKTLKATSVNLEQGDSVCVQTQSLNGSAYALCDTKIPIGKTTKWSFKILTYQTWLGLGVALKKNIQKKDFKFQSYTQVGHGGYLVASTGQTYSHLKAEQNEKYVSFAFGANDTIFIEVNCEQKKIKFRKNDPVNGQLVEIDFEIQADDELVPCACLYYANNSVELVNKIKM